MNLIETKIIPLFEEIRKFSNIKITIAPNINEIYIFNDFKGWWISKNHSMFLDNNIISNNFKLLYSKSNKELLTIFEKYFNSEIDNDQLIKILSLKVFW